jgi:hypothetical protein
MKFNSLTEEEKLEVERAKQAEVAKNEGNKAYKEKRFVDAINLYDQAI